jgi:hypothetical protein
MVNKIVFPVGFVISPYSGSRSSVGCLVAALYRASKTCHPENARRAHRTLSCAGTGGRLNSLCSCRLILPFLILQRNFGFAIPVALSVWSGSVRNRWVARYRALMVACGDASY